MIFDLHSMRRAVRRMIRAYDHPLVRTYSALRFMIFRQRFLTEIGQYLPETGRVLDIGCGVGIFANTFGQLRPGIRIEAFDMNARSVRLAREAGARLGLGNVSYHCADVTRHEFTGTIQSAYMIDTLHHIPRPQTLRLLLHLARLLPPDGRLVIKDVLARPAPKALFTLVLDRLMVGRGFVRYWEVAEMEAILEALGFEAFHHEMVDWIPYSQVLFVGRKVREVAPEPFLERFLPGERYLWPPAAERVKS